ncbi:hypothetical protein Nepgr_017889 [Nepenthes gracilis]|uniref:Reverse transcriptase domain-containing protein n=1 Tax=Nepenthes gracilis TaxID=150966 RepID=A0AAD3XSX6_NEPGR|nr:hypothetical protein Nepgr_017889 [Nepenthes gracilis]
MKKQYIASNVINFSDSDLAHVISPNADPLVVSTFISDGSVDYQVKRVFINNESSHDLLYLDAFFKLGLKKNQLKITECSLYGIDNELVPVQGTIQLKVTLGTYPKMVQSGEATDLVPLNPKDLKKCMQNGGSLTGALRDKLIAQKRRNRSVEKLVAILEEVKKLLDAGFIREIQYADWLPNVLLVKKSSRKWQICVDFIDANKACPNDSFPLPRIDMLVDSTFRHEILSFMDAYSDYNLIRMSPEDEEHTSFMMNQGTYCYKIMPFRLKNTEATYQRLVNKMFEKQIGRNIDIYVDDILVKSRAIGSHIGDLAESCEVLHEHQIKLNPAKSFTDTGSSVRVVLRTPNGFEVKYFLSLNFPATNNIAEYKALLASQVNGSFEASIPHLAKYLTRLARAAAAENPEQYSRNKREVLNTPSIEKQEVIQVSGTENWMIPYQRYLKDEALPKDIKEAKRIKKTAGWYTVVDERLNRCGYSTLYPSA